ncbi:Ribosome association toxin PasT (RatA) of the RatAB toxin-antitoxin module [Pseudidiomarina planktonica]|uniref:Ribosome association toxin PasT (RatA) of the RatAB toxin-antitoxin module n=1 Tax=Pseudidiomarina planktonica TaxID=1323738 RepID=A0A1Y6EUG6_9GAMM|nr:type II toxin-antitoxin system RatA family toxin [Pseudidiomarina planktonica]RUO65604.1 ubiquinone-binding protein [Pseudidiomarina planktonica]SMQ64152.1 Ribosome association toxin PasT (RatA) of the RatAB toxin-antitoxin module [Pseudidiomarina planktonica]
MASIERSALVSFSCQQMFDLVNDIEAYPQFVPGCVGATILEQSAEHKVAKLDISKAGIGKSFTTRNTLHAPERIDMELVDGPFKRLSGGWHFQPLSENACKIVFKLDFEFSNRLLSMAFGRIFHEITSRMVDAFAKRAQQVYGDASNGNNSGNASSH